MFKAKKKHYSKTEVLEKVNQFDIFERYFGFRPDLKRSYTNPLRTDKGAGCNFYIHSSNEKLYFKDFSRGYHWDCFDVVKMIHNCNLNEAINVILSDFNIEDFNVTFQKSKVNKADISINIPYNYKIKRRAFTKKDLAFWAQFYITEEILNKFYVYAVQVAWKSRKGEEDTVVYNNLSNFPCYAYYLGDGELKLYFPLNKRPYVKFMHTNSDTLQGYYLLPEEGANLVFTKSYKDVMAISGIFDIPAVATQSELILPPMLDFKELYNRFDNIYALYDNDLAGKRGLIKLKNKYPVTPLLFPNTMEKDFSDNLKVIGIENMWKLINKFK
jgi:hypothetical protein